MRVSKPFPALAFRFLVHVGESSVENCEQTLWWTVPWGYWRSLY